MSGGRRRADVEMDSSTSATSGDEPPCYSDIEQPKKRGIYRRRNIVVTILVFWRKNCQH